jgi:hypothetical protein
MGKPPDRPAVHIAPNASRPGLVLIAIGSGTNPFSITPEFAADLSSRLLAAAFEAGPICWPRVFAASSDEETHVHETG